MASKIQLRRDTASNWASANTLLAEGEIGFEKDTNMLKIGDGVTLWNELPYIVDGISDISSLLMDSFTTDGLPSNTPTDKIRLFGYKDAGRVMPAFINDNSSTIALQPFLGKNSVGYWNPPGNANTLPGVLGFTAYTAVGTATSRVVSTVNYFTRLRRLGYVSAATAGSLSSQRVSVAQISLGDGELGGFHKVIRFGISDSTLVEDARTFIGIGTATTAPTNVDLTTLTSCVGVGAMETDNNFKIYYGGSLAQEPIDLGPNFPSKTSNTDAYELVLFSPSKENAQLYWQVTRLNTGHVAMGKIDASENINILPNPNTLMSYTRNWRTNNTTASAVGLDIISDYIETED